MITSKLIFIALILLFALNGTASAERKDINYKVILTNSLQETVQVREFKCEDRIFLYFTWFDLKGDSHSLNAYWYKPGGKLQETTEYNFPKEHKREFNTWLWLELKKGKERGFIVPGRGWTNFIGKWNVEVFLDGEFLERKQFMVMC